MTVTVTLTVTVTATEGAEPHMEYLMDMEVINQTHFDLFWNIQFKQVLHTLIQL